MIYWFTCTCIQRPFGKLRENIFPIFRSTVSQYLFCYSQEVSSSCAVTCRVSPRLRTGNWSIDYSVPLVLPITDFYQCRSAAYGIKNGSVLLSIVAGPRKFIEKWPRSKETIYSFCTLSLSKVWVSDSVYDVCVCSVYESFGAKKLAHEPHRSIAVIQLVFSSIPWPKEGVVIIDPYFKWVDGFLAD